MEFKHTSTEAHRGSRRSGIAMVEFLIAIAAASLLMAAVMAIFSFSAKSFAAMGNYVSLDRQSRRTLDTMTKEIRMTAALTSWATNWAYFTNYDGSYLAYWYYSYGKKLYRLKNGQLTTLLSGATTFNFDFYQRTPNTNYGNFSNTYANFATTCKLLQMNWICSTNVLGTLANTESVQSAKVVIRNQ